MFKKKKGNEAIQSFFLQFEFQCVLSPYLIPFCYTGRRRHGRKLASIISVMRVSPFSAFSPTTVVARSLMKMDRVLHAHLLKSAETFTSKENADVNIRTLYWWQAFKVFFLGRFLNNRGQILRNPLKCHSRQFALALHILFSFLLCLPFNFLVAALFVLWSHTATEANKWPTHEQRLC